MLRFPFEFQKALQASGFFLNLAGGEMSWMTLLRLLYIAEREYLAEEADMITGDYPVAVSLGPVLLTSYEMVGREHPQYDWSEFFERPARHLIGMIKDPGKDQLCLIEKEILKDVYARFGHLPSFDVRAAEDQFPEWKKTFLANPSLKPQPIALEDILIAQGKPEMIDRVKERILEKEYYLRLLGEMS
jgi:hypothetical protein